MTVGLLDTSVFIARESGRPLVLDLIPDELMVSMVTIAELRLGVLAASTDADRSKRLDTLAFAQRLLSVPVDDPVAASWASLQRHLHKTGQRIGANDAWIAATAIAHGWPLVTQDRGFPAFDELVVVLA